MHPIIHLGFGIEFKQPAIIAEALAQAAVHTDGMKDYFFGCEKAVEANRSGQCESLVRLLDEIRADKELSSAVRRDDANLTGGIPERALAKMTRYASRYTVEPDELDERTAEMTNAVIYFTAGAQHPPKQVKLDFYLVHSVTCSIFYPAFMRQTWLAKADKARLLEWKVRMDLLLYLSRGSPEPLLDEIRNYGQKQPSYTWDSLIERGREYDDEGHVAKLVRALAHGQAVSKPYEQKESFRVKGDMWLQLGQMAMDSVEAGKMHGEPRWVFSAGFDEAWEKIGPRAHL